MLTIAALIFTLFVSSYYLMLFELSLPAWLMLESSVCLLSFFGVSHIETYLVFFSSGAVLTSLTLLLKMGKCGQRLPCTHAVNAKKSCPMTQPDSTMRRNILNFTSPFSCTTLTVGRSSRVKTSSKRARQEKSALSVRRTTAALPSNT